MAELENMEKAIKGMHRAIAALAPDCPILHGPSQCDTWQVGFDAQKIQITFQCRQEEPGRRLGHTDDRSASPTNPEPDPLCRRTNKEARSGMEAGPAQRYHAAKAVIEKRAMTMEYSKEDAKLIDSLGDNDLPLCSIEIKNKHGGVIIDQSLDITTIGDVEEARKCVLFLFPKTCLGHESSPDRCERSTSTA